MKRVNAAKLLSKFNKWRRGGKGSMLAPKELGEAIDEAMREIRVKHSITIGGVRHVAAKGGCFGCSLRFAGRNFLKV